MCSGCDGVGGGTAAPHAAELRLYGREIRASHSADG